MDPKDQRNEMERESDLEQDLQSIREHLSAQGDQEPPALLDQAVLNTARRELANRKRRPIRWIGAFATASVMVLALTLVLQQSKTPVSPDTGRPNGVRLNAASESEAELEQREQMGSSADADRVAGEKRAKEDGRQRNALPVQVAPARQQATLDPALDNEPAESPAPPPEAPKLEVNGDFRDASATYSDPGKDAPVTSEPLEEIIAEGNELDMMAGQSRRGAEEKLDDESESTPHAELHKQSVTEEIEQEKLRSDRENPLEWVERMLELKQNEQFEQLQLELDEFMTAFPDYPLPPELATPAG